MARHAKTTRMLEVAIEVLRDGHPMTVRQVYYQLVSRQVIENTRSAYQAVSKLLVDARKRGEIPWDWIEDRLRRPRSVSMWSDLPDFFEAVRRSYRRDVWPDQPAYLEVWLEKDALSGIFEDLLRPYGVTLNVGRGFDGWSSIHGAAERYRDRQTRGRHTSVLYFGDFDPSGEDMFRSLQERLADRGATPELVKVALTYEDIERYDLPPDFTKATDTRTAKFVAKYGDLAVELDALPGPVLRQRLESEVGARMDAAALEETRRREREDDIRLEEVLEAVGCGDIDESEDES
jgi:hypothetical protein